MNLLKKNRISLILADGVLLVSKNTLTKNCWLFANKLYKEPDLTEVILSEISVDTMKTMLKVCKARKLPFLQESDIEPLERLICCIEILCCGFIIETKLYDDYMFRLFDHYIETDDIPNLLFRVEKCNLSANPVEEYYIKKIIQLDKLEMYKQVVDLYSSLHLCSTAFLVEPVLKITPRYEYLEYIINKQVFLINFPLTYKQFKKNVMCIYPHHLKCLECGEEIVLRGPADCLSLHLSLKRCSISEYFTDDSGILFANAETNAVIGMIEREMDEKIKFVRLDKETIEYCNILGYYYKI